MKKVIIFLCCIMIVSFAIGQQIAKINYLYDEINRLHEVHYSSNLIIQYTYDNVGNRTSKIISDSQNNQPDITPTNGALASTTVGLGANVQLTFNNENLGTGSTGSFETYIVLSDNEIYESGTDVLLNSFFSSNLSGGSMPLVTKIIQIPVSANVGSQFILIVSDVSNLVSNELNEDNNLFSVPITIQDCNGLDVSVSVNDETCRDDNGTATATGSGGQTPYTFSWGTNSSSSAISNLDAGNYSVTVSDNAGCADVETFVVNNVGEDAIASFNYSISNYSVSFSSTSSFATSFSWDFGDGQMSASEHPIHYYYTPGSYQVCLGASNACGLNTTCKTVTISSGDCLAPDGLAAINIDTSTATLVWNPASNASQYLVQYRMSGETDWGLYWYAGTPTYDLTGLSSSTAYEFQIRTVCADSSAFSSTYFFSTSGGSDQNASEGFLTILDEGQNNLYGTDLTTTLDGGYVVSGFVSNQLLLSKLDPNGIILWTKTYSSDSLSSITGRSIAESSDGELIIIGTCKIDGNNDQIYVAKFDSLGTWLWTNYLGGTARDQGRSVVVDAIGNIYGVGYSKSLTPNSVDDGIVFKLNADGVLQWQKSFGDDNTFDILLDAHMMQDGNLVVTGHFNKEISFPTGTTTQDAFVAIKISPSGNLIWKKAYRDNDMNLDFNSYGVTSDADNNVYCTGYIDNPAKGFVAKLNSSGNLQWTKYISQPDVFRFEDVTVSGNELIIVGEGEFDGANYYDGVFVKMDLNGNILTAQRLNSGDDIYSWNCVVDDSFLTVMGRDEGFDTGATDNIFVYKTNLDLTDTCNTVPLSLTAQIESLLTTSVSGPLTGTPTLHSALLVETLFPINIIEPCGNVCDLTASIHSSASEVCQGESANLQYVGTGGTTFSWRVNGMLVSTAANPIIVFDTVGYQNVSLYVTDGASCSDSLNIGITVHEIPTFSIDIFHENCGQSDGTATLDVSSVTDPQIVWSTGDTSMSLTNLSAGFYSVEVTNSIGCSAIQNFEIINSSSGFSISTIISDLSCAGGSDGAIDINVSGAVGNITYHWSNGSTTNPNNGLSTGNYIVTISDDAGCELVDSFIVSQPDSLHIDLTILHENGSGASDGVISANASGGNLPYSYFWPNSTGTSSINGLSSGSFHLTVYDDLGCDAYATGVVEVIGCMDTTAHNYDPGATVTGSCETCTDGIQNGDETGVDCGGASCEPCDCSLAIWDMGPQGPPTYQATFEADNVQGHSLTVGPGAGILGYSGFGNPPASFSLNDVNSVEFDSLDYFEVGMYVLYGAFELQNVSLDMQRGDVSGTLGPTNWVLKTNLDGFQVTVDSGNLIDTDVWEHKTIDLSNLPFTDNIEIRIYAYGASGASFGRLYIDNVSICGSVDTTIVFGCSDSLAHNYNSDVIIDDGSCEDCFDGEQNGDETGVDCGGLLCVPCDTSCDHPDRQALIALYNATGGSDWLNSWDTSDCQPCSWYGITCNNDGRIICIDLDGVTNCGNGGLGNGNGLVGFIPDQIGDFEFLEVLSLRNNDLPHDLPVSLGSLVNLKKLIIQNVGATGTIPFELGDLINLEELDLSFNNLSGAIPSSFGQMHSIKSINIFNNNLSGQIPDIFMDLDALYHFQARNNNLTGSIPQSFTDASALQNIFLNSNNLDGIVPGWLASIELLNRLDLSSNNLSGCFPDSLTQLCDIDIINFTNNPLLPGGGDFGSFCSSGLGVCLPGCTDTFSHNYNPNATHDDGSCETCSDGLKNGDEVDVDCGGVLCNSCFLPDGCINDRLYFGERLNGDIVVATIGEWYKYSFKSEETSLPEGIAIDQNHNWLFWTDQGDSSIHRIGLDGDDEIIIYSISSNNLIADIDIDPENNKVYWSEYGASALIRRSDLDGTNIETLIDSSLSLPFGIALVEEIGKIYWVDPGLGKIFAQILMVRQ